MRTEQAAQTELAAVSEDKIRAVLAAASSRHQKQRLMTRPCGQRRGQLEAQLIAQCTGSA